MNFIGEDVELEDEDDDLSSTPARLRTEVIELPELFFLLVVLRLDDLRFVVRNQVNGSNLTDFFLFGTSSGVENSSCGTTTLELTFCDTIVAPSDSGRVPFGRSGVGVSGGDIEIEASG